MMKSIKIKHKEAIYILNYKKRHLLEKYFGVWRLQLTCTNSGKITCDMKWWFYILMFLPLHLLVLISCIWEGGLSAFEIIPRRLHSYTYSGAQVIGSNLTPFGKLKSVWDFHRRPSMRERN